MQLIPIDRHRLGIKVFDACIDSKHARNGS